MLPGLILALQLGGAAPCGSLDLDTAVGLALERSDELQIRRAEAAAAAADQALARALRVLPEAQATLVVGPSPAAHGTVVDSPNSNRSLANLGPFGRIDLQAVQPLYTWGRLEAASDAASAGARARDELTADTEGQIRQRVVQLFGGIALARRLLALADEVQRALATARARVEEALQERNGQVLVSDRYRLELFSALVAGRAAEAGRALAQARIGLAATLGIEPGSLTLRDQPLLAQAGEAPDAAAARAEAESRRHDLRALDLAIQAREAEVRAERAALRPQLFAAGQLSFGYAPNRDYQGNPWVRDEFNAFAVGLVLGVRQDLAFPLRSARAEKAAAERATLLRQREGLARLVAVQVDAAIADIEAARTRLEAAQSAQQSGKALFRSAGLDFQSGLIEARDLIEAYGLYVESQVGAAQAAYDLQVARARLVQATGAHFTKGHTVHAALIAALLLAAPGEATTALQARDAELRAALPAAGAALTPEVQARLEAIVSRALDVREMLVAALDARWGTLTGRQRQRFEEAFGRKLRHAAGSGLEDYRASTVSYGPEVERPGGLVQVPTRIAAKGETSEVTYTMRRAAASWRIVDITVDGVSTVENYRASFARIIAKEGVEGLLQRLERPERPAGGRKP